jgi:hypothetical protein
VTSPPRDIAAALPFEVEYYAGGCGYEHPLAIIREGRRLLVAEVRERKRLLDAATGAQREIFVCRLENGEVVTIERDV